VVVVEVATTTKARTTTLTEVDNGLALTTGGQEVKVINIS